MRARILFASALAVFATAGCQTPQWPLNGAIRSPFGVRSGGIVGELHRGVDIAVPSGTRVRPILSGQVRFAGTMDGYGNVVWIDHSEDLLSVYAHLSEIAVEVGERVTKATVIGLSGSSGRATGPHLHLEVWRWGREVDPVQFLGRPRLADPRPDQSRRSSRTASANAGATSKTSPTIP